MLKIIYGRATGMARVYDRLDRDETTKVKRIHLGVSPGKDMLLLSESGLYKLVMHSDKPEARAF